MRLLPRPHVRAGAGRAGRRAGAQRVRRSVRVRGGPRPAVRRPVPPREVLGPRAAAAGELRRDLRARGRVILYPAVDILDGQAVRLVRGDFAARTVYDDDPLDAALAWVEAGARALHVVDLDGARAGEPRNLDAVRRICTQTPVPVQVGGGLRAAAHVDSALEAGATRVVVGTAAYEDPPMLADALAVHGERVAVAVDVR